MRLIEVGIFLLDAMSLFATLTMFAEVEASAVMDRTIESGSDITVCGGTHSHTINVVVNELYNRK